MWHQAAALLLPVLVFSGSITPATPGGAGPLNLLMVGNSFSEVHNMEEMIQSMLEERRMMLHYTTIFAARFDVGGANMTHYAFSKDLTDMINERKWTYIVLQEQSQIPGFIYQEMFNDSVTSIMRLDEQIEQNGASTILFETWGYFDQDPYNPEMFPDYKTMQDKLTQGYQIYRDSILNNDPMANVKIAPAGLAFDRIYRNIKAVGEDPLQDGSLFEQMFMKIEDHPTPDHNKARKYPTVAGSYLCGCVLYQTITGLDVRKTTYKPPELTLQMRTRLQQVAYDTVVEFSKFIPGDAHDTSALTKPPYKPQYERTSEANEEDSSSPFARWSFAAVLAGVALTSMWVATKKRAALVPRNYGWNAVPSDDTGAMELSGIPSDNSDDIVF